MPCRPLLASAMGILESITSRRKLYQSNIMKTETTLKKGEATRSQEYSFPMPPVEELLGLEQAGYRPSKTDPGHHYFALYEGQRIEGGDEETSIPIPSSRQKESVAKSWSDACLCQEALDLPMPYEHVLEAIKVATDFIWYHRCYLSAKDETQEPASQKTMETAANRIRKTLGKKYTKPVTDQEFNFMLGRLATLREITGWIGDGILDT